MKMKENRCLYELLRADGSIVVNKRLAQAIGLNEAVIFSELVSRYFYFLDRDKLTESGYFYNTVEDLQEGTTIKEWEQRKCIKKLVELGLIKVKIMGVPAKRHFKLAENSADILISLLNGKEKLKSGVNAIVEAFQRAGANKEPTPEVIQEIEELLQDGAKCHVSK